ncbi:unnamed protein product, partial [Choristocarpus tenellus]
MAVSEEVVAPVSIVMDEAHRSFCSELEEAQTVVTNQRERHSGEPVKKMVNRDFSSASSHIRSNLIGRYSPFQTPFGAKPLVYADWTATGRPLAMIEHYIMSDVMPLYGNTHTTTSVTGAQTTCFRHEARQIIAQAVNAKKITGRASEDVVLFTGSGATAAVAKLVSALGLSQGISPGANVDDRCEPLLLYGRHFHLYLLIP